MKKFIVRCKEASKLVEGTRYYFKKGQYIDEFGHPTDHIDAAQVYFGDSKSDLINEYDWDYQYFEVLEIETITKIIGEKNEK